MKNLEKSKVTIGHTPLIPMKSLDKRFSVPKVYIKDESTNPTGTAKDRRNQFIISEAERLKVDKLALITSGNNGYSLGVLAKTIDLPIVCIVDRELPDEIKKRLESVAYQVIEVNLQHKILRPEEVISFAREREDEVIWDVTNGYEESYRNIVGELLDIKPDYIVVPVGSGEIFVGVVEGVQHYNLSTRVIGIGVQNTLRSFADKLHTPWTPYFRALEALQERGHSIYRLSEEEVKKTFKEFKNIVKCEPSSAVVFSVFIKKSFDINDTIVLINSGRPRIV